MEADRKPLGLTWHVLMALFVGGVASAAVGIVLGAFGGQSAARVPDRLLAGGIALFYGAFVGVDLCDSLRTGRVRVVKLRRVGWAPKWVHRALNPRGSWLSICLYSIFTAATLTASVLAYMGILLWPAGTYQASMPP